MLTMFLQTAWLSFLKACLTTSMKTSAGFLEFVLYSSWQRMPTYPSSSNLITMKTTFGKTVNMVLNGSYFWAGSFNRFLACKFYRTYGVHLPMIYLTLSARTSSRLLDTALRTWICLFVGDHPSLEHSLIEYGVNRVESSEFCAFLFSVNLIFIF